MSKTTYEFKRNQFLPISIERAWEFFSDPRNLSRITPASMDFRIVSEVPAKVHEGLVIEYRVKPLLGIPMRWVSVLKDIKQPFNFVDEQLKGPYAYWHHQHTFREVRGGVMMEDIIHYQIPFQGVMPWLNEMIVVNKLGEIFDFREETLLVLFGNQQQ